MGNCNTYIVNKLLSIVCSKQDTFLVQILKNTLQKTFWLIWRLLEKKRHNILYYNGQFFPAKLRAAKQPK